jgi:HlyD family secretion protein
MATAVLDKTRIRAPLAATVLQLNAKVGEMVAPTPDAPLVTLGDVSVLRVRAEVDEHDVSKIKLGQKAVVRNNGYPGQDFSGKVTELAPSLAAPRMGSRGARRATDVEVLEVLIDMEGSVPLLPGMRTEVFFMP